MHGITRIKQAVGRIGCAFMACAYAPVMMAAGDWFPKVMAADDLTTGGKSAMSITGTYVKQGLSLVLFIVSIGLFMKFISTVSHGIEESKKNEGGSIAVFGTYTVMASIYLAIGIATAYLGYSIITKFQL